MSRAEPVKSLSIFYLSKRNDRYVTPLPNAVFYLEIVKFVCTFYKEIYSNLFSS